MRALSTINPRKGHTMNYFDTYEIHGVAEFTAAKGERYCEPVEDAKAQYWSLYGHVPGEGVECIGDFKSRKAAEAVLERITGGTREILRALDYLLEQTVDMDLKHGIALTEGEEDARTRALAVLEAYAGERK